jgi:hypothetical protein
MNLTKKEIFEKLSEIEGVEVFQLRPASGLTLPCIIFQLSDLNIQVNLDKELINQSEEYTIDIYAQKTTETSSILSSVEEKMRELGYVMEFAGDIPDPDSISHLNTRFKLN